MPLLAILLTLLLPAPAGAFTLASTAEPRHKQLPAFVSVDIANCATGEDTRAMTDEAIQLWNSVATSSLRIQVDSTAPKITVRCGDAQGAAGITSVTVGSDDSILAAEVILDSELFQPSEARTLLMYTITHELGHAIGLGHSTRTDALMYYSINSIPERVALTQDEVDGTTYLYPRDEPFGSGPLGCLSLANVPRDGGRPPRRPGGKSAAPRETTPSSTLPLALELGLFVLGLSLWQLVRRRQLSETVS